ncbi:hypothetical protein ACWIB8_05260 [Corynebacterium flavescens]
MSGFRIARDGVELNWDSDTPEDVEVCAGDEGGVLGYFPLYDLKTFIDMASKYSKEIKEK